MQQLSFFIEKIMVETWLHKLNTLYRKPHLHTEAKVKSYEFLNILSLFKEFHNQVEIKALFTFINKFWRLSQTQIIPTFMLWFIDLQTLGTKNKERALEASAGLEGGKTAYYLNMLRQWWRSHSVSLRLAEGGEPTLFHSPHSFQWTRQVQGCTLAHNSSWRSQEERENRSHCAHSPEQGAENEHSHTSARLHVSALTMFRLSCLGNGATNSGCGLPTSINVIKTIPHRHANLI